MNKRHLLIIIVLIISSLIFMLRSYWGEGFPYTHDGENHLIRFANYEQAVRELQIPPRFAPNLHNHYGYPVFNFNYPLANILSLPFMILNIHVETIYKILVFFALFFAGIGVYILSIKKNQSYLLTVTAVLLYFSSPFLLNSILYRGNIGETLAYCLLPWLVCSLDWIKRKEYLQSYYFIFSIVIWNLFLLSHNVSVLITIPVITIFFLFNHATHKNLLIRYFLTVGISAVGSLWFWLPAIIEKGETVLDNASNQQETFLHFPTLQQLLSSPLSFGFSLPGSVDGLSFSLGYLGIITLILGSLVVFFHRSQISRSTQATLLLLSVLIFFQLPLSAPVWKLISLSQYIQFPWRLSLLVPIFLVILLTYFFPKLKKSWQVLLVLFFVGQLLFVWSHKPVDRFHRNPEDYLMNSQTTSTQHENMPKDFTYTQIADWQPQPSIISGKGNVTLNTWRGSYRRYDLDLQEESIIVEPTANFLGWQTKANDKLIPYINNTEIAGRLAYSLPAGKYTISSRFTEYTPARIVGDTLSLLVLGGLIIYTIKIYRRSHA